jgi:hypothetical protein
MTPLPASTTLKIRFVDDAISRRPDPRDRKRHNPITGRLPANAGPLARDRRLRRQPLEAPQPRRTAR